MVSESIVCGIDASEHGRTAVRVAVALSSRLNRRLVLVHVADVPAVAGASGVPGAYEELRETALLDGYDLLERAAHDHGAPAGTELIVELGDPAERIAAVANEEAATLIVVASRGLGGKRSALLGSVSASLTATAPCPVTVVPPRALGDGLDGVPGFEPVRDDADRASAIREGE